MTLYLNVSRLCAERGLSLSKLSRTCGLCANACSGWAKHEPSVYAVKAVADFFGVTVDELLREGDPE